MDHTLVKKEFDQFRADFSQQVKLQLPAPCFELSFADASETLATIATLIDAGLAMPDALEARLCKDCGAYHARRVRR